MRAFFCIPIPDPLCAKIHDIAERLRSQTRMSASWVAQHNYHITLRFLGDIDPALTVGLDNQCRTLCRDIAPFVCSLDRVGAFPSVGRARVLWVGGEAPASFCRLTQALSRGLVDVGFPEVREESVVHVTLARVKDRPDPALPGLISELNPISSMEMMADRVVLMESTLTQRGAIYSPLFSARLGARQR